MRTEDGHIIGKCLNGDSAAFGLLVDKYKASIYALAYSKLHNFHDAEDVTQEAFIKAYRKLHTLRWWDNFLAWLYAITSNLCRDWIRSQSRRPDGEFVADQEIDVMENPAMDTYQRDIVCQSVREELETLPEIYRQVLTLYYLGGMNTREIARFLGTSPSNVSHRLIKARSRLKKEMVSMMNIAYQNQRLQASFTFRIVEMVKRIKIKPIQPERWLPLGMSTAMAIAMIILGLAALNMSSYSIDQRVESLIRQRAFSASHYQGSEDHSYSDGEMSVVLTYANIPTDQEAIGGQSKTLEDGKSFSIAGTLVSHDGKPVEGAIIRDRVRSFFVYGKSDRDGKFTISRLWPNQIISIMAMQSDMQLRGYAKLEAKPDAEVTILMERYEMTTTSVVVIDQDRNYIPSAKVDLVIWDSEARGAMALPTGVTDEYGKCEVPGLIVGNEYSVSASAEGYRRADTGKFTAEPGIENIIMLTPIGKNLLEGIVRDTDGNPVVGASVWGNSTQQRSKTDENGHFQLGDLPYAVEINIMIDHREYGASKFGYIPTNQKRDFVIVKGERFLMGKVVDANGNPVINACVFVESKADEISGHVNLSAYTNDLGTFRLKNIVDDVTSVAISSNELQHYKLYENVETNQYDATFVFDKSLDPPKEPFDDETIAGMEYRSNSTKLFDSLINKPAPELDVAKWLYGNPVALAELEDKVIVLYFWSPGLRCNLIPAIQSIRLLNTLQEKYGEKGLVCVGIHSLESEAEAQKEIIGDDEIICHIAMDKKPTILGPRGMTFDRYHNPAGAVVIDKKGNIHSKVWDAELEETIQKLLLDE